MRAVARRSWQEYYKGESTTEWKLRGTALDDAIKKAAPSAAMELGTYCGYSAVRIGRLLPPGGKLVSVEVDPLYAAIATKVRCPALLRHASPPRSNGCVSPHARQVVEHAGLGDSVKIEIGDLAEKFDRIATKYSLGPPGMSESAVSVVPQLTALARGLFLEAAGCVGLPVRASEPFRARWRAGCHAAVRRGRSRRFRGAQLYIYIHTHTHIYIYTYTIHHPPQAPSTRC